MLRWLQFWWWSKRLASGDVMVRVNAAVVLGHLRDRRAVELLLRTSRDHDPLVRAAAAEALGRLRDGRALGRLSEVLGDDAHGSVRAAAAQALGELGITDALGPLLLALVDGDPRVRTAAAQALAKLGDPQWEKMIYGGDDDWKFLAASTWCSAR